MTAAQKIQYFENIKTHSHKDFVKDHGNCALCSNVLELKHEKNEPEAQIKEEAYCVECDIKARAKIYALN